MNNKKVFSVPLFINNFLQLKLVGILGTIVMAVVSVFSIASQGTNLADSYRQTGQLATASITMSDLSILFATFVVVTPVLVLMAFSYNNKRNSSDFYNSLPYTRLNMYLTKIAAVFAWQLIMYVVTSVGIASSIAIYREYFIYSASSLAWALTGVFICNLICGASIALACSLTGNLISNICLSGLIMFLPMVLCMIMIATVHSTFNYASDIVPVPLIGNVRNILADIIYCTIIGRYSHGGVTGILADRGHMLYTVTLAIVYLALGLYFFKRRKSEIAGKAAVGNKMQFAIRTIIGFVIVDFAAILIISDMDTASLGDSILTVIIILIAGFISMLVYELLTGDKTELLKKTAISFGTAIAGAIVFTIAIGIGAGRMKVYTPDADKISYVQIEYNVSGNFDNSYYAEKLYDMKITDKSIIEKFTEAYINCKDKTYSEVYSELGRNERAYEIYVYFKDGVLGRHRAILISEKAYQDIVTDLSGTKEYRDIYYDMPKSDNVSIDFNNPVELDKDSARKLYESAVEEIKAVDFATYRAAQFNADVCDSLYATFVEGDNQYSIKIPLTQAIPKTTSMYMKLVNQNSQKLVQNGVNFEAVKSVVIDSIDNGVLTKNLGRTTTLEIFKIDIIDKTQMVLFSDSVYEGNDGSTQREPKHDYDGGYDSDSLKDVKDKLERFNAGADIDPAKPFYQINVKIYGNYGDNYYIYLQ